MLLEGHQRFGQQKLCFKLHLEGRQSGMHPGDLHSQQAPDQTSDWACQISIESCSLHIDWSESYSERAPNLLLPAVSQVELRLAVPRAIQHIRFAAIG